MPRADLLALTPDDLAVLTNRGTVKRAQKELESGEVQCEFAEQDGDILCTWSDGVCCRFPADKSVHDAQCSSGATGISRHIIRTVLAYQRQNAAAHPTAPDSESAAIAASLGTTSPASPASGWDPGAISDDALIAQFRKPAIQQARRRFEQGVLVELTRGTKPVARFLDEGCTIRFLVPGDVRYISADCAESLLPMWVPLAVWSFRELPADQPGGLLSLQQTNVPVAPEFFAGPNVLLTELARDGAQRLAESWLHRLTRYEQSLREAGLVWPAELLVDLHQQLHMYRQHDARFDAREVVSIIGEWIARRRAIVQETTAVPQPLIRGTKADRPAEIASGRLIGVGLGIRSGRTHTTVSAYLQDVDSGTVSAVERIFADKTDSGGPAVRLLADLAETVLVRGITLAGLASSQLLMKTAKRTPGGQLILPRTAGNVITHPQAYQWEHLQPPFYQEGFRPLAARLEQLPPSCLRPRRRTENLAALAVCRADDVQFDAARQQLSARLIDERGDAATLVHPFHSRAHPGFNHLQTCLTQRGDQVRFVCGHVRMSGRQLELRPISLIFDDGQRRQQVIPWLPGALDSPETATEAIGQTLDDETPALAPVPEIVSRLEGLMADALIIGLNGTEAQRWDELTRTARQIGFVRLAELTAALSEQLELRKEALNWDATTALKHWRQLCLWLRLAEEAG